MDAFGGMKIIETLSAYETVEDWSGCRSIPRAIRRAKRGKKQRMIVRAKPKAFMLGGVIYAHPDIVAQLRIEARRNATP